jgi:hypothetical protein
MGEIFDLLHASLPEIIGGLVVALILGAFAWVCAYWKRRDSRRQKQAALQTLEVEFDAKISELRIRMLNAKSRHELQSILYEVDALLQRNPHNVQVVELKNMVAESMPPRVILPPMDMLLVLPIWNLILNTYLPLIGTKVRSLSKAFFKFLTRRNTFNYGLFLFLFDSPLDLGRIFDQRNNELKDRAIPLLTLLG